MPRASTVHAVIAIGIDLGKSTLALLASKQESHGNAARLAFDRALEGQTERVAFSGERLSEFAKFATA